MISIAKQKPFIQFLIGLGIGITADIIIQIFLSLVLQTIIFAALPQILNTNIIGPIALFLPLAIFIATLVVLQKTIKSKFLTIGVAAGWIGVLVILNVLMMMIF